MLDFPPMRITPAACRDAVVAWGANCGPGALAGVLGLTLEEVRPHLGDFETKGYTNPALMWSALRSLAAEGGSNGIPAFTWRKTRPVVAWANYGLARIQWEGPWTAPGRPMAARQRHTHWIGTRLRRDKEVEVFDINAVEHAGGWIGEDRWVDRLAPWLLRECEPEANGRWHLTHVVEIGL